MDLDLSGLIGNGQPAAATVPSKQTTSRKKPARPNGKPPLYFDLETVPDLSRVALYDLPPVPVPRILCDLSECTPVATAKDWTEDPLKKYLAEVAVPLEWLDAMLAAEAAREKQPRKGVVNLLTAAREAITGEAGTIEAAAADNQKRMALSPFHNRIVAFSWSFGWEDECRALLEGAQPNGGTMNEQTLLEHFWAMAAKAGPVVGYNIVRFDLPVIYVRSMLLGVNPTRYLDPKPWGGDVVDLYAAMFPFGTSDVPGGKGLKNIDKALGLERESWELNEETDGSLVTDLYQNDRPRLLLYARSDVAKVKRLHLNFRGMFCS